MEPICPARLSLENVFVFSEDRTAFAARFLVAEVSAKLVSLRMLMFLQPKAEIYYAAACENRSKKIVKHGESGFREVRNEESAEE